MRLGKRFLYSRRCI